MPELHGKYGWKRQPHLEEAPCSGSSCLPPPCPQHGLDQEAKSCSQRGGALETGALCGVCRAGGEGAFQMRVLGPEIKTALGLGLPENTGPPGCRLPVA